MPNFHSCFSSNAGRSLYLFSACLFGAACSSSGETRVSAAVGAGSGGDSRAGATAPHPAGGDPVPASNPDISSDKAGRQDDALVASIQVNDVPPGSESHDCVLLELPNTTPVWVNELHGVLTGGSHHLVVARSGVATPLSAVPQSCSPTMADDNARLIIAQQRDSLLRLPDGVAYRLYARQRVFLQLHYINATDRPARVTGTVELRMIEPSLTPKEALSLFDGQRTISVPARSPSTADFFFDPNPSAERTRHVFALTSHMHQLGVRATIERVASLEAPATEPLHVSTSWSEPPITSFDTPLDFSGGDGLRLHCDYQNDTNHDVSYGTGVNDEMCFMWMYYYED